VKTESVLFKMGKTHWSFQPVKRPVVPVVKNKSWVKNPIDNFILAKLEAKNLTPAAKLGKRALIRRVSYDLTGLPPTPEEVEAFVADTSPSAYEKVVDYLPRRTMVRSGGDTGWIWCATPRRTRMSATTPNPTCFATEIT
jgi:hypothetical protein